jgi:hypothetical protein
MRVGRVEGSFLVLIITPSTSKSKKLSIYAGGAKSDTNLQGNLLVAFLWRLFLLYLRFTLRLSGKVRVLGLLASVPRFEPTKPRIYM